MTTDLRITTPRGAVFHVKTKGGEVKAVLKWDENTGRKYTDNFTLAQKFVDNEVLRFCSSRVPFRTGMLQKSGILGTVVGSGLVAYIAPYSAPQYYKTATTRTYDANRGGLWFERGKAAEGRRILLGAQRLAGG